MASDHAEQGLHHLRLAMLDVLTRGKCLGPTEIGRQAGIEKGLGHGSRWGFVMTALLDHMEEQGLVERCTQWNGRPGWSAKAR